MKAMVGVVAIACAVGCNLNAVDTAETAQAATTICQDTDQPCGLHNGGGVYTEEHGNAHVGGSDFMIMRFVNQAGGGVALFGRGDDGTGTGDYAFSGGTVKHAYYYGTRYPVYSIQESLTVPTVTLGTIGNLTTVPGDQALTHLKVVIDIGGRVYTLSWTNPVLDPPTTIPTNGGYTQATLHMFEMTWNEGDGYIASAATPYCTRAPGAGSVPDWVVFQQGIAVHPLTAVMIPNNPNFVTLSCRYGAIATARLWGYIYRGTSTQTDMFEAAMHMKRASYCGDISFFTRTGTVIAIKDTIPNMHDDVSMPNIEASWGRATDGSGVIRALCVDPTHLRRPGTSFEGMSYDPYCGGSVPAGIPTCDAWGNGLGALADALQ